MIVGYFTSSGKYFMYIQIKYKLIINPNIFGNVGMEWRAGKWRTRFCSLNMNRFHNNFLHNTKNEHFEEVVIFTLLYIDDVIQWPTAQWVPASNKVNLRIKMLPKLEGLLHSLIFSVVLTQMKDFKLNFMAHVMTSIFLFSISPFSSVTYPLSYRLLWIIYKLKRYARTLSHFTNFINRGVFPIQKLLQQNNRHFTRFTVTMTNLLTDMKC